MKLNGKQYDKFILNGKTYEKFYLNNKIYQSLYPGIILDLPLQNNFTDYSASGISMVAGNANGFPSFVSDGSGGYLADFVSSKAIKTASNITLGSDSMSVAFFIKTTQTTASILAELSSDANSNNDAFVVFLNVLKANRVDIYDHRTGSLFNGGSSSVNINNGILKHIAIVVNRSLGTNQNKIYVDGVLSYLQNALNNDNNGNYNSYPLFIGARNGNSNYLVAQMKQYTMWNYPISQSEVIIHKNR